MLKLFALSTLVSHF